MSNYAKLYNPTETPQSEAVPGKDQVQNNAGGFVFQIDKWDRLRRFLILGSDAPTYYQRAQELTPANARGVIECWQEDADRTGALIAEVSVGGLAPKNDPAIFALALGSTLPDPHIAARQRAFSLVPAICRTATHLFTWMSYRKQIGGGDGRGFKRAVNAWYEGKTRGDTSRSLAIQAIKYRNRAGWSHKDALAVAHRPFPANPELHCLYKWMYGKEPTGPLPPLVEAHLEAMATPEGDVKKLVALIGEHRLPWEALPTWALTSGAIWEVMIPHMGLTALIRQLGAMTAYGAITMQRSGHVTERLADKEMLRLSRVHPFTILQALAVYRAGYSQKAAEYKKQKILRWEPVPRVIDALDAAFYDAFGNVESTGKRILLALDISGSMCSHIGGSLLSCREASSAMAMVTLAREPNAVVVGFTAGSSPSRWYGIGAGLTPLTISARQRLDDVCRYTAGLPLGGTDCALPFAWAREKRLQFDAFIIYTDNETWSGQIHPVQALQSYRRSSDIMAKSVVVGMTSTGFSIADPADGGMLDCVGFDSSAPAVISDFIRGS